MYFATGSAKVLSTRDVGSIEDINDEESPNTNLNARILGICANNRRSHFCTWTSSVISVWKIRPPVLLASLRRTSLSLEEHGLNDISLWSPDGSQIVVKTTKSHIVLINVFQTPDFQPFTRLSTSKPTHRTFLPGPGESQALEGLLLQLHGVISIEGDLIHLSPRTSHLLFSTQEPAAVQRMPWPGSDNPEHSNWLGHETWLLNSDDCPWLKGTSTLQRVHYINANLPEGWITSDGRAYFMRFGHQSLGESKSELESESDHGSAAWLGNCIYPSGNQDDDDVESEGEFTPAVEISINPQFSVVALGLRNGKICYIPFPADDASTSKYQIIHTPTEEVTGKVTTLEWTSDGYALAIGWEHGWGVVSVGGRFLSYSVLPESSHPGFEDTFMTGVGNLFWGQGNFEIFLSSVIDEASDPRIAIVSFAKSNFTTQQTPDNTRYAFLMMDDRVLVYRGADQPDMSVINPESDVWQNIKIPVDYIAKNWPLRYSIISSDGRLIAVAGRRGLTHYSMASGRWKLFENPSQEQSFLVRGGMAWFHHVLVVAVEMAGRTYRVQLYSRDLDLAPHTILHNEDFDAPIIVISLIDNSLLVYTEKNELHHFLVLPTADAVILHNCGSISFDGIVLEPFLVRGLSWMIPTTQKNFGDPVYDLTAATILMLVGGSLVLLTPRKDMIRNVQYDLRILADRVEFFWIHLRGIGALENSLWGFDGSVVRVWLDALSIYSTSREIISIVENVSLNLDFYPLSVMMDKGIIIGAEQEVVMRQSLPFANFRIVTNSHLFIPSVLLYHFRKQQVQDAVAFASQYQTLVFFGHSLEVLLHTVLEGEDDIKEGEGVLPAVVEFLDHFDVSLDVVVGCARKTEMSRWKRLFDAVGNPRDLFETCLKEQRLPCAASYLLVLHNLQQPEDTSEDAVRLLSQVIEAKNWDIGKDLLRFLRSIDENGEALKVVLRQVGLDVSTQS